MTTIELLRPIQAHGRDYKRLELREPNGLDIQACGGTPMAFMQTDMGTIAVQNPVAIAKYISRLGEIPPSSVNQLGAQDWMRLQTAISNFFNEPDAEGSTGEGSSSIRSTDTLISPGPGNGSLAPP